MASTNRCKPLVEVFLPLPSMVVMPGAVAFRGLRTEASTGAEPRGLVDALVRMPAVPLPRVTSKRMRCQADGPMGSLLSKGL